MRLDDLVKAEADMPIRCKKYFSANYSHTESVINLLDDFVNEIADWKGKDAYLFIFALQKHLIQALFSTARMHQSQYAWNLRQAIEAGVQAAYCFANEVENPTQLVKADYEKTNSKFRADCYKWLEKEYSEFNLVIKNLKEIINKMGTHSGFIEAQASLYVGGDAIERGIEVQYFDSANDERIKLDLWTIANVGWGFIKIFINLNKKHNIFKIKSDTEKRLILLGNENDVIKNQIMQSKYYQALLKEGNTDERDHLL